MVKRALDFSRQPLDQLSWGLFRSAAWLSPAGPAVKVAHRETRGLLPIQRHRRFTNYLAPPLR